MGPLRMEDILKPGVKLEARVLTSEEIQWVIDQVEKYEKEQREIARWNRDNYFELIHRPMDL